MAYQKGQSGNPAGRPPGKAALFRREINAARKSMGDALMDSTQGLIDLARGIHVIKAMDTSGRWHKLDDGQAQKLAADPAVLDALLDSGMARVYLLPPDLDAIRALQDRIMGKVPTIVELEVKQRVEQVQADHVLLVRVIQDHVPQEFLGPVVAELERITRRGEEPPAAY